MRDDDAWFAPKRYGYGAGLPIRWQGWALLGGYVAALAGAGFLIPRHWVGYVIVIAALTVALLVLCARHTAGGWRWRWGD